MFKGYLKNTDCFGAKSSCKTVAISALLPIYSVFR